jgi:hypothetical protein
MVGNFCQILLNFYDRFSKNTQTLHFTKIRPVGAELFHAYGQVGKRDDALSRD